MIASILRATYLVDDLEGAGICVLDLSAPNKQRIHIEYRLDDLPIVPPEQVAAILQHLANAFDLVCAMERDWKGEGAQRRPSHPAAPPPPGLFG